MSIGFRRFAQAHPVQDEAAVGPQGAGESPGAPALTEQTPCAYCGSREVSEANETGRGHQSVCAVCGGAMSTSGDNVPSAELIGDPSNHPKQNPDPDSGGVGGAGNLPTSPKVVYDRPGEHRMPSWEASLHSFDDFMKTAVENVSVARVFHNGLNCPVCNRPEGFHSHRLASEELPHHTNPLTGEQHWYHGTSYDPVHTNHPDGYSPSSPGGKIVAPKHEPRSVDHVEASWNTDLGTHFSTMHMVADQGFARPGGQTHNPAARVAHTRLHMSNPIHFGSESEMNSHAINWALGQGHHYLPKKQSEHSKFRGGDYAGIQHKDGTDYSYLEEHHSGFLPRDTKGISEIDKRGVSKGVDESPDLSPRSKLRVKEQWLETHPKRAEISAGYTQHLKDQGHDGVLYGNEHEGPEKHTCAIAFHDTPVSIDRWEWMNPSSTKYMHDHLPGVDITNQDQVRMERRPGHGRGYNYTAALDDEARFHSALAARDAVELSLLDSLDGVAVPAENLVRGRVGNYGLQQFEGARTESGAMLGSVPFDVVDGQNPHVRDTARHALQGADGAQSLQPEGRMTSRGVGVVADFAPAAQPVFHGRVPEEVGDRLGLTALAASLHSSSMAEVEAAREFQMHMCATWADVRNKATDITKSGGVHIAVASGDGLGGTVQGEHNVYETFLTYVPGTKKVAYWHCGCKWAAYSWGRSPAYKRFEGRMCSHALAMQFEAQRQHGFGRKPHAEEHGHRPDWMRSDTRVVVHHQRPTERAPERDHFRMGSTGPDVEGVYPSGHALDLVNTPLHAIAAVRVAEGTDPGDLMRELLSFGAAHEPAQRLVRQAVENPELLPTDGTEDAREHAEDFGVGVPHGKGERVGGCDQCGGRGCGACAGTGQMVDHHTPIVDQNVDAGERSRGKESVEASMQQFAEMTMELYDRLRTQADYSSHDAFPYSAPESGAMGNSPDHSFSKNPGSTGYATSQDPHNWDDAWAHRDDLAGQHFSAKQPEMDPPTHAGVALKAHDTGNVLFLQRAHPHKNPDDPAAGKWEFPGGGLEPGDHTTLHGAIREWEEEVGLPFPPGGTVHHTWRSGPYQGHLVVIPQQDAVDPRSPRVVDNPDDDNEAVAWHNPRYLRNRADTRDEVKSGTPWGKIERARLEKAAELHDEPEPALPVTTAGEEEPEDEGKWGPPRDAKGHIPVGGNGATSFGERYRSNMTPGIGGDESVNPSTGSDHITTKAAQDSVADIVARFQASGAAQALQAVSGPPGASNGPSSRDGGISNSDIALAAKTALKNFTPGEQAELINEGAVGGGRARNFTDLRIQGTHYEDIPDDSEELVL